MLPNRLAIARLRPLVSGVVIAPVFVLACSRSPGGADDEPVQCRNVLAPLEHPAESDPRATIALQSEAGFVELPPDSGCSPFTKRLFYSFRPADDAPATRPLLVMFNGGPGYATSLGLAAYGTGPKTLQIADGATAADAEWEDNPHSFTSFANLLYIDESLTGFSYGLGEPPDEPCGRDREDAAEFLHVVLSFLERHPELEAAPVVFLGESYGGYRAVSMLDLLLHHAEVEHEQDIALADRIERHLRRAFPEHVGPFEPEDVARQFGRLVSVQGALLPMRYYMCGQSPTEVDPYDISRLPEWSFELDKRALQLLIDEIETDAVFGVPFADIEGLAAVDRTTAFRLPVREGGLLEELGMLTPEFNQALESRFGELGDDDAYFRLFPARDFTWGENLEDMPLTRVAPFIQIFATNALNDGAVCVSTFLDIMRPDTAICSPFRMATYEGAGHAVAVTHSAQLAGDLEAWLYGTTESER